VQCSQKGAIVIRIDQVPGSLDTARILASVGEAAYEWRLDTDTLIWSGNAAVVLGAVPGGIAGGRAHAQRVEAAGGQNRFKAITAPSRPTMALASPIRSNTPSAATMAKKSGSRTPAGGSPEPTASRCGRMASCAPSTSATSASAS
jgi:hypothetical protein